MDLPPVPVRQDLVDSLIKDVQDWLQPVLASHKSARQCFHKLSLLADLGLRADHPGIAPVVERILEGLDPEGIPLLTMGQAGGESEVAAWALCDAPTTLHALLCMGVDRQILEPGIAALAEHRGSEGWGCHVSDNLNWRGPGKKGDPCPYATLLMVKLLSQAGGSYLAMAAEGGLVFLDLWEASRTRHPYQFHMGTTFRTLALPFVWYDILHVVRVLTRIPALHRDPRLADMVAVIRSQRGPEGYRPGIAAREWKAWDFGQTTAVSAIMTTWTDAICARMRGGAGASAGSGQGGGGGACQKALLP